jgi:cytochrome c oxidase subunit 2
MILSKSRFVATGLILVLFVLSSVGVFANADEPEQVIRITAKRFEYAPSEITLKKGVPVILEFTSLDRLHGFNCPGLGVRTDIYPDKASKVRIVPQKAGSFEFNCDNFCGSGHSEMRGKITVTE